MATVMPLGDILTITTGRLVSRDHIDGVYRILNFMTGDSLYTHQLGRAMDECSEPLLTQHPQLRETDCPEFASPDDVRPWLEEMEQRYGTELAVEPLTAGEHQQIDPLTELASMRADAPIVVVVGTEAEQQ